MLGAESTVESNGLKCISSMIDEEKSFSQNDSRVTDSLLWSVNCAMIAIFPGIFICYEPEMGVICALKSYDYDSS